MFDDGTTINVGRSQLGALATALDGLRAPTEPAFVAVGDALLRTSGMLQRLEGDFAALALRLQASDGATAGAALTDVLGRIGQLAGEEAHKVAVLEQVATAAEDTGTPLRRLGKIIGEVEALSVNARIEAAMVSVADVDFSVFTTEISRLGSQAGRAVDSAADHLARLSPAIAAAKAAELAFERSDGRELDAVRGRLGGCLATLAERQRRAGQAAGAVAQRSRQIAERLAACIAELQINDLTSQRVDHIAQALRRLDEVLDPGRITADCQWAAELDGERRQALIASVCRLQAGQLDQAAAEFCRDVGRLKANLATLAADAGEVLAEATTLLGGASETSFVEALRAEAERAAALLGSYATAEERLRGTVERVSSGFAAMAEDLAGIQSLDADMRVMGLNASLKCGRLGPTGRALGVVAQELRGCSRRTEEVTRTVAAAISTAVAVSATLSRRAGADLDGAAGLVKAMAGSIAALDALGGALDGAIAGLAAGCSQAAGLLSQAAANIAVDRDFAVGAQGVTARLKAIADQVTVSPAMAETIQADIRALLTGRYTMASERILHDLFADGGDQLTHAAKAEAENGNAAVDSCFF